MQDGQERAKQLRELAHFLESAKGFDASAKLRLGLVCAGLKPATYVALRAYPKNLAEKAHFEQHLRRAGLQFKIGRGRTFEEIEKIKEPVVRWRIAGTWYGYDIFQDRKVEQLFSRYLQLLRQGKHREADVLGAKLYGYPDCCSKQFGKEHDKHWLAQHFTSYEFYKRAHDADRAFPFVTHTPCAADCEETAKQNRENQHEIRKLMPKFHHAYAKPRSFGAKLVVDAYSDIYLEEVDGHTSIWPEKDGFEYAVLCTRPIDGKYYLLAWLSQNWHKRGTVIEATVRMRYKYADIIKSRVVGQIDNLHHERKFPLMGTGVVV